MFQHFFKHFFRECGMLNASKRTEGDERVARYTIEDIEILRKKSGITYEEAVNLLEYHDGSLARALVDLERNGRLKGEGKNAPAQGPSLDVNALSRASLATRSLRATPASSI